MSFGASRRYCRSLHHDPSLEGVDSARTEPGDLGRRKHSVVHAELPTRNQILVRVLPAVFVDEHHIPSNMI